MLSLSYRPNQPLTWIELTFAVLVVLIVGFLYNRRAAGLGTAAPKGPRG